MNLEGKTMQIRNIPQKAQIDGVFDFVDLLFELVGLFNALIQAIFNLGQLLNGEQPFPIGTNGII